MSCYNAPIGSVWRLNKYGADRIYMLFDHIGVKWFARRCLDLQTGDHEEFTSGSAFDEEAEQISSP
jgi:hypothetical protein